MAEHHPVRRLLFLLPFAPRTDGTHGGSRVMAQLLTRLALRHQVGLLYLRAADEPPIDTVLKQRCEWTEEVVRPTNGVIGETPWLATAYDLYGLLRGRPLWSHYWANAEYKKRVYELASDWQPDIVQMEYHIMAQYLPALAGCRAPRVLTEHEPGVQVARERWQVDGQPRRIMQYLDLLAWEWFERAVTRKVDAVVVFTERDQQVVATLAPSTPIVKIPLGTVLPERPFNPVGTSPLSLVFIGNFIHPPNVDAAARLVKSIFPRVRKEIEGTRLTIVGDQPPPDICQRTSEHIHITGLVPDVTPYLDQAALVVVPLRIGGGMRVKVLEALAAGKAIVASSLAVEGLNVEDGQEVVLAESDEEFCRAIVQLLSDPIQRTWLAGNARAWAEGHLSWDQPVAAYERLYERLLE